MSLLISVLEQGMIYAIMSLGVYITYKILDFPDLTVDGSFPFGAALGVILITNGWNPLLTLPIAFFAGAVIGILTGLIHVKLKVRDLLSGIIMMTALYSINLRVAGRANLSIFQYKTIFDNDFLNSLIPESVRPYQTVIVIIVLTIVIKILLDWYMSTKSGFMLRAVGDNDTLVTSMGINKGMVKIVGLAIANGLVALSGCIFAQQQRYFDVSFGTGTVVIGLASVIIGTSLCKKITLLNVTSSVVLGSLLYKGCVALAIWMGLKKSSDLKFVTSMLFLVILVISMERKQRVKKNA